MQRISAFEPHNVPLPASRRTTYVEDESDRQGPLPPVRTIDYANMSVGPRPVMMEVCPAAL